MSLESKLMKWVKALIFKELFRIIAYTLKRTRSLKEWLVCRIFIYCFFTFF